ncbi:hypothetical protein [Mannheimia indoligenes]|uniref:hypothetical protein n=1 Tax=Mannheimia indoligenes TaxID=3103145 RepID=UPI002FE51C46
MNSDGKSDTSKERVGNDGNKVTGIDRVVSYVNDTRGHIIQESNDYNVDDIIDSVKHRVLDANGNLISVYNNLDNDESTGKTIKVNDGRTLYGIENSDYRVLDPRGYITEYKMDNDGDGIFDYHNYDIRDPNGNLVATYFDTDADSSTGNTVQDINGRTITGVEKIDYITRNGSGYSTKVETDIGADGSINKTVYEERNNNGYLLGSYSDLDQNVNTGSSYPLNDGRQLVGIDSVTTYEVDPNGFITKGAYDYNSDGTPDRIDYFVKSPQGYIAERYFDFDGSSSTGLTYTVNGKDISGIDRFSSYTLNELGLIVTAVIDNRGAISRNYDVYNNKRQLIELY